MRYGNVANGFKLTALTIALVSLAACGGGGSSKSKGTGSTPPPVATPEETEIDQGGLDPVEETAFQTLDEAIAGYTVVERSAPDQTPASGAFNVCKPQKFYYIDSARKLQVGFQSSSGLTEAERLRLAKISALALDATLTNYGFTGGEPELITDLVGTKKVEKPTPEATDDTPGTLPYFICVKSVNNPLDSRDIFAEIGPFDKDAGFYRQAKDQFANSITERLRSTTDNYEEIHFWFDEGLANFSGDNALVGSSTSWTSTIAPNGALPNPMEMKTTQSAGISGTNDPRFFQLYPYYATTLAYILSPDGLNLTRSDMKNWSLAAVQTGSNFEAAFNQLGLGQKSAAPAASFSSLKGSIVSRVDTWLDQKGSSTTLTDWSTAPEATVTAVTIARKPDWQFAPIKGYNIRLEGGAYVFDSLVYTLASGGHDAFITTRGPAVDGSAPECYGPVEVAVTNDGSGENGKLASTLSLNGVPAINCNQIPL